MSGSLRVTAECRVSGPLADGLAAGVLAQWAERTTQALGDEAVAMLRAFPMDASGRARGAFAAAVHATRVSPTQTRIAGPQVKGVVWASWLEGTSKRNQRSKFKGYHLFRKTRLAVERRAPQVAREQLDAVLPQIGGA